MKYSIPLLKNSLFWNQLIGDGCFNLEYIHDELTHINNHILLAFDPNLRVYDNIEGILIYRKINNLKDYLVK